MALDVVTGILDAFTAGERIALPLINDYLANHGNKNHVSRIEEWNNAQAIKDPVARANAEWDVITRLLTLTGKASGCAGTGPKVSFPIDTIAAFVELASENIALKEALSKQLQGK